MHPRQREPGAQRRSIGKTIITTDGTTLLGADDKAGVAVIMEAARILIENPAIPHGPVRVVFTCDEEIGHGVMHLEPGQIGAVVAYTLDGMASGEIEDETFSADAATVTDHRREHPPVDRQGADDQRRPAGGHVPRPAAEADAEPGDHRRPARGSCTRSRSRAESPR